MITTKNKFIAAAALAIFVVVALVLGLIPLYKRSNRPADPTTISQARTTTKLNPTTTATVAPIDTDTMGTVSVGTATTDFTVASSVTADDDASASTIENHVDTSDPDTIITTMVSTTASDTDHRITTTGNIDDAQSSTTPIDEDAKGRTFVSTTDSQGSTAAPSSVLRMRPTNTMSDEQRH